MINYLLPLILIICQFVLFILKKSKIVMILIPILLSIIAVIIAVYIDQVMVEFVTSAPIYVHILSQIWFCVVCAITSIILFVSRLEKKSIGGRIA